MCSLNQFVHQFPHASTCTVQCLLPTQPSVHGSCLCAQCYVQARVPLHRLRVLRGTVQLLHFAYSLWVCYSRISDYKVYLQTRAHARVSSTRVWILKSMQFSVLVRSGGNYVFLVCCVLVSTIGATCSPAHCSAHPSRSSPYVFFVLNNANSCCCGYSVLCTVQCTSAVLMTSTVPRVSELYALTSALCTLYGTWTCTIQCTCTYSCVLRRCSCSGASSSRAAVAECCRSWRSWATCSLPFRVRPPRTHAPPPPLTITRTPPQSTRASRVDRRWALWPPASECRRRRSRCARSSSASVAAATRSTYR